MPHSTHYPLTAVMEHVVRLQPTSVLDVGVGYGKWGFLLREALDWMQDRHDRASWRTSLVGLEAFAGYSSPLYDWVYDEIVYEDVLAYSARRTPFDLVMMGDVLEHLTKDDGYTVLRNLLAVCRNVIVATPVDFFTQDILDNPWEAHQSLWRIEDLREWTYDYDVVGHTTVVACIAGAGADYPTRRDRQLSDLAYRLPSMSHQGLLAKLVKQGGARSADLLRLGR